MTLQDILKHFGNWGVASRSMNMGSANNQTWRRKGYIPIQTQIKIEILSGGALQAKVSDCEQQFEPAHKERERLMQGVK